MNQPVKVGIVGLGRVGWQSHCKELGNLPNQFQITAVCDPIEARRQIAVEKYGCKAYEDIEQLVNDPEVELVNIATRSIDHFAHGMQALSSGKKVLIEKPFSLNYRESLELAETAKKYGEEQLFVRHNRRFDPDFIHVRNIINSGILGEVYHIKLCRHRFQRRDDWQTLKEYGGGQLLNWGPHIIDHGLQLLQSPLKSIWGDLKKTVAAGDAEDYVKIILTAESGRTIDIEISGGSILPAPVYQVYGTRGGLLSQTGRDIYLKYLNPERDLPEKQADHGTPGEKSGTFGSFQTEDELYWIEKSMHIPPRSDNDLWEALYRAIRLGEPFPVRLEEALEVMKVISEVKEGTAFALDVAP